MLEVESLLRRLLHSRTRRSQLPHLLLLCTEPNVQEDLLHFKPLILHLQLLHEQVRLLLLPICFFLLEITRGLGAPHTLLRFCHNVGQVALRFCQVAHRVFQIDRVLYVFPHGARAFGIRFLQLHHPNCSRHHHIFASRALVLSTSLSFRPFAQLTNLNISMPSRGHKFLAPTPLAVARARRNHIAKGDAPQKVSSQWHHSKH
jgi:hypothetical protein